MDFATIDGLLRTWIVRILGTDVPFADAEKPRGMQVPKAAQSYARIELDEPSKVVQIGRDWQQLGPTGTITVVGNREITYTLRIIDRSHTMIAHQFMERLRTSLMRQSILDFFLAQNISIVDYSGVTRFDAPPVDGRDESVAIMTLTLGTTIADLDPDTTDTIVSVDIQQEDPLIVDISSNNRTFPFSFTQATLDANDGITLIVPHGLNRAVAVVIYDDSGDEMRPALVHKVDENTIEVSFDSSVPISGTWVGKCT